MNLHSASVAFISLLAMASAAGAQPPAESASDDVPVAVAARLRAVAEGSPRLRAFLAQPRTLFIGVDLIRRKDDGRELAALYRVQHYRYADDTVMTSLVELETGRVTEQVETPHAPVRLTAGELDEARALALADRRVSDAIGPSRLPLVVEPLVVRTSDPRDPWYGRRIVRLLFRLGSDYLSRPTVFIDLTRREVIIQPSHGPDHGGNQ